MLTTHKTGFPMNRILKHSPHEDHLAEARPVMRAFIVSGSASTNSHTRWLADECARNLYTSAVQCRVWDLAVCHLPLMTIAGHQVTRDSIEGKQVEEYKAAVLEADMIVLATPVYHGSYSGVLKNAIDHLGKGAFAGKVIGLLSHGCSHLASVQPLDHLRTVTANLHGHPLPTQLSTCDADFRRNQTDAIIDTTGTISQRIRRIAYEMQDLSRALKLVRTSDNVNRRKPREYDPNCR